MGNQRSGGLRLSEREFVGRRGRRARLEPHAWMPIQAGIRTEILGREAVLHLEPGSNEHGTHGLYVTVERVAQRAQPTRALAKAASARERRSSKTRRSSPHLVRVDVTAVHAAQARFVPRRAAVPATNAATPAVLGLRNPVPI